MIFVRIIGYHTSNGYFILRWRPWKDRNNVGARTTLPVLRISGTLLVLRCSIRSYANVIIVSSFEAKIEAGATAMVLLLLLQLLIGRTYIFLLPAKTGPFHTLQANSFFVGIAENADKSFSLSWQMRTVEACCPLNGIYISNSVKRKTRRNVNESRQVHINTEVHRLIPIQTTADGKMPEDTLMHECLAVSTARG